MSHLDTVQEDLQSSAHAQKIPHEMILHILTFLRESDDFWHFNSTQAAVIFPERSSGSTCQTFRAAVAEFFNHTPNHIYRKNIRIRIPFEFPPPYCGFSMTKSKSIHPALLKYYNRINFCRRFAFSDKYMDVTPYLYKKELNLHAANITDASMLSHVRILNLSDTDVIDVSALGGAHTLNLSNTQVVHVKFTKKYYT